MTVYCIIELMKSVFKGNFIVHQQHNQNTSFPGFKKQDLKDNLAQILKVNFKIQLLCSEDHRYPECYK
jgi:hypothetical protein